ncbi:MAG: IPTL-CTERM sorting domain-containing protein [Pseudomonadota bacterium]
MKINRISHFFLVVFFVLTSFLSGNAMAVYPGNAMDFDGTDDEIVVPALASFPALDYTIESWIYLDNYVGISSILSGHDNPADTHEFRVDATGHLEVGIFDGAWTNLVSVRVIPLNQWAHVAVTRSGNNFTLYINGENVAAGVIAKAAPAGLTISMGRMDGGYPLDGKMDEVRLWNVARTQAEIRANINNELANPAGEADLILYFQLNEGVGGADNTAIAVATDSSANGFDGTPTNIAQIGVSSNWVSSAAPTTAAITTTTADGTVPGTSITYTITSDTGTPRAIAAAGESNSGIWSWTNNFPEFVTGNTQVMTVIFSAPVPINRLVLGVNSIGVNSTLVVAGGTASTVDFDLTDGIPYGGATLIGYRGLTGLFAVGAADQSLMIGSTSTNTITQLTLTSLDNGGDGYTLFFGAIDAAAATAIPTLSEWMLILLSIMLGFFAAIKIKAQREM